MPSGLRRLLRLLRRAGLSVHIAHKRGGQTALGEHHFCGDRERRRRVPEPDQAGGRLVVRCAEQRFVECGAIGEG